LNDGACRRGDNERSGRDREVNLVALGAWVLLPNAEWQPQGDILAHFVVSRRAIGGKFGQRRAEHEQGKYEPAGFGKCSRCAALEGSLDPRFHFQFSTSVFAVAGSRSSAKLDPASA
jgi:hypothetical protein